METTLAVNPGSSSKKYALYRGEEQLLAVAFEKMGDGFGKCVEINGTRQRCEDISLGEYGSSLAEVIRIACAERYIQDGGDITCVGVRIVAPGTFFQMHRAVDSAYLARLKRAEVVAPLHISSVLDELRAISAELPHVKIVGVSDSAFHRTIPDFARTYSIPYEDTTSFDIYRFGYHGLSVGSVVRMYAQCTGRMPARAVVCHVGSGVSVTALRDGVSVETSMGFSPASGLMMGTRAGNIDPGALMQIESEKKLGPNAMHAYLNHEGGLKGFLGNGDLRVALDRKARGDLRAAVAVRMYVYGIKKQIGASIAALGGIDALIFTATAVERNPLVRTLICEDMETFGILLDHAANDILNNRAGTISSNDSPVRIEVIPTDELHAIAQEAQSI